MAMAATVVINIAVVTVVLSRQPSAGVTIRPSSVGVVRAITAIFVIVIIDTAIAAIIVANTGMDVVITTIMDIGTTDTMFAMNIDMVATITTAITNVGTITSALPISGLATALATRN